MQFSGSSTNVNTAVRAVRGRREADLAVNLQPAQKPVADPMRSKNVVATASPSLVLFMARFSTTAARRSMMCACAKH